MVKGGRQSEEELYESVLHHLSLYCTTRARDDVWEWSVGDCLLSHSHDCNTNQAKGVAPFFISLPCLNLRTMGALLLWWQRCSESKGKVWWKSEG